MKKNGIFLLITLWVVLLIPNRHYSLDQNVRPLLLSNRDKAFTVKSSVKIYLDSSKDKTIHQIISDKNIQFKTYSKMNFGTIDSVVWIRFTTVNLDTKIKNYVLSIEYPVESMTVFQFIQNGKFEKKTAGYSVPGKFRAIAYPRPAVSLTLTPHQTNIIYIRCQSKTSLSLPIEITPQNTFNRQNVIKVFYYTLLIGTLLGIILYNLFVGISLREKIYFFYVFFLFFFLIYLLSLSGYGSLLLWNHNSEMALDIVYLSLNLLFLSFGLFSYYFLEIKTKIPKFRWVFFSFYLLFILHLFTSPFLSGAINNIIPITSGPFFGIFILIAGFISYRRDNKAARFFLISWSLFIFAFLLYGMKLIGVIPHHDLTQYGFQFFGLTGAVSLSFSVADRIRILRQQKEKATKEAFQTLKSMNHQKDLFVQSSSKFVPSEFIRFMGHDNISNIRLGEHIQKNMTIFFSDIFNFTTHSEKMSPEEVFSFLNLYFSMMGPCIRKNGGFIDKYIGDGIMALFPEHPDNALKASIEMQHLIFSYHQKVSGQPMKTGIGLHTGEMMLGTIGEQQRMETTVVSDHVNLASRIETLTRYYQSPVLISKDVYQNLKNPGQFHFRTLDTVKVKGKSVPVTILEAVDAYPELERKLKIKTLSLFDTGMQKYREGDIEGAELIFEDIIRQSPDDYPVRIFLNRCTDIRKNGKNETENTVIHL